MSIAQPFPLADPYAGSSLQAPRIQLPKQDLAVRLICPECRDSQPNIEEEFSSGDLVCRGCGLVLGDRIVDTRSEWRTFANEEGDDPSRVGGPTNPIYEGLDTLSTSISFRDGNTGHSRELQRASARLSNEKSQRSLTVIFEQIQSMCDQYSLPRSVSDTAKMLYRRCEEEKLLRGKQPDAIVAACLFIACRQAAVPRTFREIVELTNVPKKQIGQCYKALERAFNLTPGATAANPDLMARYCNYLALPPALQAYCSDVAGRARARDVGSGRSPVSIASGIIYFTAMLFGYSVSLKEIGATAGVSEGTIKLVYRLLWADREALVNEKWFEEGKVRWENLPSVESKESKEGKSPKDK
ncbi:hypothetical protein M408DRAFT_74141 [Serendipita vermifera MAFF 305830]|uniref:Transcription initiation factor IIB n=1 Tax=Serendipita vermifera MAFF 305830 TaxID=933852 RepID=A0A0C3ALN8_SERVB|nr:hypothetical protein M408DRAFT_74141 [Serendipita vermifera MAFF 305830]